MLLSATTEEDVYRLWAATVRITLYTGPWGGVLLERMNSIFCRRAWDQFWLMRSRLNALGKTF